MSYDAQKVTYQEVTIFDRPALFTECRIDQATVPEGVYRYYLRCCPMCISMTLTGMWGAAIWSRTVNASTNATIPEG